MIHVALHPSERAALRAARRPVAWRAWRRAALIAAPIVAAIGVATPLALHAISPAEAARRGLSAAGQARPAGAAIRALASPGGGTTGTAELPPEPLERPLAGRSAAAGITPARPFSLGGVAPLDRGRALECLTTAIYYEAASEPDDGQRAVAQVVLNRVRHPAFPATVCGVIYQGAERASGCQFSYACDGSMARAPSRAGWARAARIAAAALNGYVFRPVGLATHYHTYAVTPAWNRTLVMTDAVGAHFFHRWKGFWGTAAAFDQPYRGREPTPGPPPRTAPALAALPTIALAGPVAVAPATQVQPEHRERDALAPAPAVVTETLPDSQILERWKDAGKPLK